MVVHIMMNIFLFVFLSYWQVLYYVGCSRSIPPPLLLAASVIQHFLITMCNTNQFFIGSFELSISISSCVGHCEYYVTEVQISAMKDECFSLCECFVHWLLLTASLSHTLRYKYCYKRDFLYKPGSISFLCFI